MKIFLDANVLVAILNRQYPLFTSAARIISLADHPRYKIYTSPLCLAIAYYFAEKKSGSSRAKEKIALLSEKLYITSTDTEAVILTLKNVKINDFEDGLEYYSAIQSACDFILTEDVSDFYFSEIPVFNCEDFMKSLS